MLTTFDVTICVFRIAGDETKVQVDSTNTEGYTALHYACWQGHQKVAKLLKEAKADPSARYEIDDCSCNITARLRIQLHLCRHKSSYQPRKLHFRLQYYYIIYQTHVRIHALTTLVKVKFGSLH